MKDAMLPFVFLSVVVLRNSNAATHKDLIRLHQNLTTDYNKDVRPTFNQSQPTKVTISFALLSIKELEEKTSKLAIVGIFTFTWNDFQLTWNPQDYDDTYSTILPQNMLWKPELVLINPYDEIEPLGFDRQTVRLLFTGDIYWFPADVYQSSCPIDVTFYPFDVQTCFLIFGSLIHVPLEVFFESSNTKLDLTYFYPNGLWEIKDTGIEVVTTSTQMIMLKLELKRRSIFHILNTLVPISVIGLLNVLVFLLPAESGERVSFSVTVLLAMAVFMTIVTDSLPSNSEPNVPRLCYLLAFDLGVNALVTVCAVLGLRLHHKPDTQQVPQVLRYLVCSSRCVSKKSRVTDKRLAHDKNSDGADNSFREVLKEVPFDGSVMTWPKSENGNNERQDFADTVNRNGPLTSCVARPVDITWRNVAASFDRVFFVLFIVALLAKDIAAVFIFM